MNKPSILCDKCDIYMSCLLDYDGILCRKNRTVEPTNADRLNAMTVEEKAEWLYSISVCYEFSNCPAWRMGCSQQKETCINSWLDWLNKTASDTYWLDWLKGVNNGE